MTSQPRSAWSSLAHLHFRAFWIASVASHIGSYMTDVGQGWLMASLTPSPLIVSLLLTADPCIDGTRITVMDIVKLERMGLPPQEMRTRYSSRPLTLAEVHATLTYYYDHQAEIDASFEEDRQWDEGHEDRRDEYLRQKAGK